MKIGSFLQLPFQLSSDVQWGGILLSLCHSLGFWLPLLLMPFRSKEWNASAVFILATQQHPWGQLLQVLKSVYLIHVLI